MSLKQSVVEFLHMLLQLLRLHGLQAASETLLSGLRATIPVLLRGYGASLSSTDRACLRLMLLSDCLLVEAQDTEVSQKYHAATRMAGFFGGPLSEHR
jgi:hypothetical protein